MLALSLAGCDSGGWFLGTFSHVPNRVGLVSLVRYEFRDDGTLIRTEVRGCREDQQEVREEYEWRSAGPTLVIVSDVRDGDRLEDWHIRRGHVCNAIEVERVSGDEVTGSFTLSRGALCLYELPPCEINCEACDTGWCDEPPPACDE